MPVDLEVPHPPGANSKDTMTATPHHCTTCLAAFATPYLFDHHVCPGRPGTSTAIVEAFDPDVDGDPSELNASRRLDF